MSVVGPFAKVDHEASLVLDKPMRAQAQKLVEYPWYTTIVLTQNEWRGEWGLAPEFKVSS